MKHIIPKFLVLPALLWTTVTALYATFSIIVTQNWLMPFLFVVIPTWLVVVPAWQWFFLHNERKDGAHRFAFWKW